VERHLAIEVVGSIASLCIQTPDRRERERIDVSLVDLLQATLPSPARELPGQGDWTSKRAQIHRLSEQDVYLWIRQISSQDRADGWSIIVPYLELGRALGAVASATWMR
jgi:hypothetical protein